MTRDTWNPDQYARFRDERSRPFYELMALVQPPAAGATMRVIDLGCGTGELTQVLHKHLAAGGARVETVGLDSSPSMLEKAGPLVGAGLRFVQEDIPTFAARLAAGDEGPFDLIFSNAALQWVGEHPTLVTNLGKGLASGGQLAVQVPANGDHSSHLTAAEIAREEPFSTALGGHVRIFPILAPEEYATLLDKLGFAEQEVRLQVFGHHLGGREDVIEWVKGTLLTDYQKRLSAELWEEFLTRYRERLLPRLEDTRPYFYAFKRTLFWGLRSRAPLPRR
jgi:trans-aconitate 2-methyltransferase